MARAVRARSDENVGPRVRANEPPDEHASEGARTPAPSLSAPGPRELRVRAVRGGERAAGRGRPCGRRPGLGGVVVSGLAASGGRPPPGLRDPSGGVGGSAGRRRHSSGRAPGRGRRSRRGEEPSSWVSAPRRTAALAEIKDMFAVFNWEQLCVLVFPRRLTRSFPSFSGPGHPVASSQSLLQHSILSDGSALSAKLF
ncbi:UDP-GalNAc:beta-1,3-N-acetylgalactosaminyltransferase 1 isoform X3 [Saccopteryx bilineata]|uniref:UDP-GalNAc:beta-1, 3-N-acetylgalactosaminyltransferase 1 isoform X3 n=1 Tax=Saccopteryx bilineata TaxID=59482 RepID=UPI00338EEEDF